MPFPQIHKASLHTTIDLLLRGDRIGTERRACSLIGLARTVGLQHTNHFCADCSENLSAGFPRPGSALAMVMKMCESRIADFDSLLKVSVIEHEGGVLLVDYGFGQENARSVMLALNTGESVAPASATRARSPSQMRYVGAAHRPSNASSASRAASPIVPNISTAP